MAQGRPEEKSQHAQRELQCIGVNRIDRAPPSPFKTQKLVLIDSASLPPRFEPSDWSSFVQHAFHVELQSGLPELTAFAEH